MNAFRFVSFVMVTLKALTSRLESTGTLQVALQRYRVPQNKGLEFFFPRVYHFSCAPLTATPPRAPPPHISPFRQHTCPRLRLHTVTVPLCDWPLILTFLHFSHLYCTSLFPNLFYPIRIIIPSLQQCLLLLPIHRLWVTLP
jgi:hypothetical protein